MPSSYFDIFCFEFQHARNFFFKKKSLPYQVFLKNNNTVKKQPESSQGDFAAFCCAVRN